MKKYIAPEMDIVKFSAEDVITASTAQIKINTGTKNFSQEDGEYTFIN